MRKLPPLFLFVLAIAYNGNAQIGYEEFYSEKDLQTNLENAKTLVDQLDATGSLALYHKKRYQDSLAKFYLKKVFAIAEASGNVKLTARAFWWNVQLTMAIYEDIGDRSINDTAKKFLQYAEQAGLIKEQMEANLALAEINVHQNTLAAEQYCIASQNLLNKWTTDTLDKDSLRLQLFLEFTHAYIHRNDGIKTSKYLQAVESYSTTHRNERRRIEAIDGIGMMYFEWPGHDTLAFPWLEKEYRYFAVKKEPHGRLRLANALANLHSRFNQSPWHKEEAKKYLEEAERLNDSLRANCPYQRYWPYIKQSLGMITSAQIIETIDGHFNNQLCLPIRDVASAKAALYLGVNQDSAMRFLSIAKQYGRENRRLWYDYYSIKKDNAKMILLLQEMLKEDSANGDLRGAPSMTFSLGRLFQWEHQYKLAAEYLSKAWYLRDSLDKLTSQAKVAEMEMQRQMDAQKVFYEEQETLQHAEQARAALKNRIRLGGTAVGAVILLLIAGILWRNNRRKQKDKLKIEHAYNELKSTQAQLIQSEKMASLGELTAGIAHEIQNPLNFVNNFSEVNNELIEELKMENGKLKAENSVGTEILHDIYENNEKIILHGKRADAIVKGMLQHSRSSSGQKDSTDINALADEYLRLAYHGLRAKDKNFNAEVKTDFDPSIGKIEIVPQDIGRVILNLVNNAFYAVSERGKLQAAGYTPQVVICTKKLNNKIEIRVKDNGNGIPDSIKEKIFQPFFTTKPTGQGTGLGLSLAYDIVKAHGGEIKVSTKEGEGSELTFYLLNNSRNL